MKNVSAPLAIILCVVLPPLAIWLLRHEKKPSDRISETLLNVLLCAFGFVPGVAHAVLVYFGGASRRLVDERIDRIVASNQNVHSK